MKTAQANTHFFFACMIGLLFPMTARTQTSLVDQVHPLVGTQGDGQTYPAVGLPFAMTDWSPQTRAGEVKGVAPYYFGDARIQGFRGSHFLSGSAVADYGSFTVMASVGGLKTAATERASTFDRSTEHASPYAYAVKLEEAGMNAEITAATRSSIMRFIAARAGTTSIVIENNARGGDGWINVNSATHEITGEVPVRRVYAGSGKLAGFSSFFFMEFSEPFISSGTWVGPQQHPGGTKQAGDGVPPGVVEFPKLPAGMDRNSRTDSPRPGFGVYVQFANAPIGHAIVVRIGTSFVSVEEAHNNLKAEIPDWGFDNVRNRTKAAWERSLHSIEVKDRIPATAVFYTAMYHALLHPRTFSDADGSYPGFAAEGKTEHAQGFRYYDDFSMWDIFRAQLPMLTIIDPQRDVDFLRSLIAKGEQGGYLPIFPAWNSYTSEMIGDHSSVAIIDAYSKGLRGFDIEKAYRLIRQNALTTPSDPAAYNDGKGRRALDSYLQYGYIPLEDRVPAAFHKNEQVSRTLEYAYDDAMIAKLAASLGKASDAATFRAHGENWRNVMDPQTGFARGRYADGSWVSPFDPAKKVNWITEGLPWQYTFFVPQDIPGLIKLEGGNAGFIAKLDCLFDGHYYDHGNEPSHHIAYLYDAAGQAYKTQQHVRALMESEYRDEPGGLAGNDDAGQMSAWYILSALGFYQVAPGVPEYWFGSPRFDEAKVTLPGGRTLIIEAKGAGTGKVYVRSVSLNGRKLSSYTLSHSELMAGGVLRFEMSDEPRRDP